MNSRLPVYIENLELPEDKSLVSNNRERSYGYVNVLYLLSLIVTLGTILTILFLGK